MSAPRVIFIGEEYTVPATGLTIGRQADVVLDERNKSLHRQSLAVVPADGLWWLCNVGAAVVATVIADDGNVEVLLRPGGRFPLVYGSVTVRLQAGAFTYDFVVFSDWSHSLRRPESVESEDPTHLPAVELNVRQRLVLLALCEPVLRDGIMHLARLPTAGKIAVRLGPGPKGETTKKSVERTIEDLRTKFAHAGVVGITSSVALAEFAVVRRLVRVEDLALLDANRRDAGAAT